MTNEDYFTTHGLINRLDSFECRSNPVDEANRRKILILYPNAAILVGSNEKTGDRLFLIDLDYGKNGMTTAEELHTKIMEILSYPTQMEGICKVSIAGIWAESYSSILQLGQEYVTPIIEQETLKTLES